MEISNITKNIHIRDYLSILRRRKWIAISFFFITVTSVTIATFMQEDVYRATATVIVEIESPNILPVKDVVQLGEPYYFAYREYIETQQEIIRSRRTAHQVMKNLKLANRKGFKEAEDPVGTLLRKMHVELMIDTRILKISADDGNPKLASLIANEFAKVYAGSNITLKIKASSQAVAWLKEEVEEQKEKVKKSEINLQRYKEDNDIISFKNQENIINDALVELNTSYLDAQKRRIKVETAYKSILSIDEDLTIENLPAILIDNKAIQELKQDYIEQETLMAEYRKVYKHKHPKMIRLLENIGYLKSQIKEMIQAEYNVRLNELETRYNNAMEEENKFKEELDEQKKRALGLERKIINYNALKREVETNERILQIVLNRLKETSISTQIQTNNVRVQDTAEIPKNPVKPKKRLNIALAIILGSIGGASLAFFRDYMDPILRDPSEISNLLQVPILGSVSKLKLDRKNIKKKSDVDRIVEKDPNSLASEVYRTIRTNLLFSINHSSSPKTIVVTSSVPKEGKTLTAVNLATMIANSGEKVLLVDCDMRKPRIHTIFNQDNKIGLSYFLQGKGNLEEIVQYSGIDNLYLVTSGKITNSPAELISSRNMKLFIEKVSLQFTKIIFDTPPITLVTDAAVLSSITTGVVLVAEGSRITKGLLGKSKELLQNVDAKILGIILNNIDPARDIYSYPQYYYGKYYRATS